MDVLVAAGLGIVSGIISGMPLGVVNVAIVEAASAGDTKFAARLGIGGALADMVHSTLAFGGISQAILANPEWTRPLTVAAAAIVVAYVLVTWRRRKREAPPRAAGTGVVVGILMTLPNPGALAAWVVVATSLWPDIPPIDAGILGVGVGIGSALWFTMLARVIAKRKDQRIVKAVARGAVAVMIVLAAAGIARAFLS